jgi:hypothetical protein
MPDSSSPPDDNPSTLNTSANHTPPATPGNHDYRLKFVYTRHGSKHTPPPASARPGRLKYADSRHGSSQHPAAGFRSSRPAEIR